MPARVELRYRDIDGHVTNQAGQWTRELNRRLSDPELIGSPLRDAMEEIGQLAESAAIMAAPMRSGQTIAKMTHVVQRQQIPKWVAIRSRARNKGFPYPWLVHYAERFHHRLWMQRAIRLWWPRVNAILDRVGVKMKVKWRV